MWRIDDVLLGQIADPPFPVEAGRVHLKVDVQGFEKQVLLGAEQGLAGPIRTVQLEMSLIELYEGQALASDLHDFLVARGFQLWDIVPGFRNAKTLRLLQYDGIYLREADARIMDLAEAGRG